MPSLLPLAALLPTLVGTAGPATALDTLPRPTVAATTWQKLPTVPYGGKQDDVVFTTPTRGWYVNGGGRIYRTTDGGATWTEQLRKPGTYFRAIGFVNDTLGFAGNIGTEYFPGVTDTVALYRTRDGGATWAPVTGLPSAAARGICAIDVLHAEFIDAGRLARRTVIHAGGRVGGPAQLLRSIDGGETWRALDLSAHTAMILDVKFFSESEGLVMGASSADVAASNAVILRTVDGGRSWTEVYRSTRPFELTWKGAFPTRTTGYVTVQSYDPDTSRAQRVVAKTTDGGKTWREVPLVRDHAVRQFGVGFVDERLGWVGTVAGGYRTTDGGATWTFEPMGRAVNKIRIVPDGAGFVAYAIGVELHKLALPATR